MPKLSASDLAVGFGDAQLVGGINFSLAPNSIIGILGRNGSGKTTLLRTIAGELPAIAGAIAMDGQPISELSSRSLSRRIAFLPQLTERAPSLVVGDLVLLGRLPHFGWYRHPGPTDRALAASALEAVGISHLRDRKANHLSGGERRLVSIAATLAKQAELLLLDEPTASLDVDHAYGLLDAVAKLARDHAVTVVFSSHDLNLVLKYADTVVLLTGGGARVVSANDLLAADLTTVFNVPYQFVSLSTGGRFAVPTATEIRR